MMGVALRHSVGGHLLLQGIAWQVFGLTFSELARLGVLTAVSVEFY
jgi:hypothetical protein